MSDYRPTPWPFVAGAVSLVRAPILISDMKGKRIRVVKYGDSVTAEKMPGRVTIFLNEDGVVADVFYELEDLAR